MKTVMIHITNLLSRWNVSTTMRVIFGLSLVIFLTIIYMNYRAIGQVHDIGNEIHQTTQNYKDLWQNIAISNARIESLRYALLHTKDASNAEQMHKLIATLNNTAASLQDQNARLVEKQALVYERLFDNLINAFKKKDTHVQLLQKQREALEILIYEAEVPSLETTIIELKPSEVRYFWNPTIEWAKSIEVFLDSVERDISAVRNEDNIHQSIKAYRTTLHTLIAVEIEVKQLSENLGTVAQEVENIVINAVMKANQTVKDAIQRSNILVATAQQNALVWTILGILVPLVLTIMFDRSFCHRMHGLMTSLYQVAQGNLTIDIKSSGNDEIAILSRAANEMRMKLAKLMEEMEITTANNYRQQEQERIENEKRMQAAVRGRERQVGEEIAGLAAAFVVGDLTKRMATMGREGILLTMSENINRLANTIDNVITDVCTEATALSTGDLEQHIAKDYQGAYFTLKHAFNTMSERLVDIVRDIDHAVHTIAAVSGEIANGSADLSKRTEQQAASLEETAAAVEQLSATVRANTANTQLAKNMAIELRNAAEQGSKVAGAAINAMELIENSSHKITDIIGVIENIAFQTNLLSLNAAVEAARAGDAGRGFAVVAQEVRMLAQRSAQASKEIKILIVNSDHQVKNGVEQVKNAGNALTGITRNINQVDKIIGEIAHGSAEQSTALKEINIAVNLLEEMTQRNASLAEETTAAVDAMKEQASDLLIKMTFFKFKRTDT